MCNITAVCTYVQTVVYYAKKPSFTYTAVKKIAFSECIAALALKKDIHIFVSTTGTVCCDLFFRQKHNWRTCYVSTWDETLLTLDISRTLFTPFKFLVYLLEGKTSTRICARVHICTYVRTYVRARN